MSGLQNGRDPARGDYDWRAFATALKHRQTADGRGLRALADEAGVTLPDLSRALGGQIVSTGKVFALCDWLGRDPRDFYLPPEFGLSSRAYRPPACAPDRAGDDARRAVALAPWAKNQTKSERFNEPNVKQHEGARGL